MSNLFSKKNEEINQTMNSIQNNKLNQNKQKTRYFEKKVWIKQTKMKVWISECIPGHNQC